MSDLSEAVEKVAKQMVENGQEPEYHVDSGQVPFFLAIYRPNGEHVEIDVEEHGWMKTYAEWMRGASRWYLISKPTPEVPARAWLAVDVREGDQPYYTARHIVRVKGHNAGMQIVAYGIGAKRGEATERMWVLPNGLVCCGDDVEALAEALIDSINN